MSSQPNSSRSKSDHTACQAAHNAMYEAAVEAMENPGLMTPRDAFEYRLGTTGHAYHRQGTEEMMREHNETLEHLRETTQALKRVLQGQPADWVEWDVLRDSWNFCRARGVEPSEVRT